MSVIRRHFLLSLGAAILRPWKWLKHKNPFRGQLRNFPIPPPEIHTRNILSRLYSEHNA